MKPAFYALTGGGWRDWWTLLHPPYTLWHLSYVALGASVAPELRLDHLGWSVLAFLLAVGLGAHALDELNGRPLRTAIPERLLRLTATLSIAGALTLGVFGVVRVGAGLIGFMVAGGFLVAAYNLEWLNGRFHSDAWFALAWGGFPALTGGYAQAGSLTAEVVLVGAACVALSAAQRTLSTPVRALRRRTDGVTGTIVRSDGSVEEISAASLGAPLERALRAMSIGLPLLAAAAVLARA